MTQLESDWYVVFEGTGERPGNDLGLVTLISFSDGEAFESFMAETGYKDIVLAKGIDQAAARKVRSSSPGARLNNILHESTDGTGRIAPALVRAMVENERIRRLKGFMEQTEECEPFWLMANSIAKCLPDSNGTANGSSDLVFNDKPENQIDWDKYLKPGGGDFGFLDEMD